MMKRRDFLKTIMISPLSASASAIPLDNSGLVTNSVEALKGSLLITPEMFGARADGKFNNKIAIEQALNSSSKNGGVCVFLPGDYFSEDININVPVEVYICAGSYLNFNFSISGENLCSDASSKIQLSWKSFQVGSTNFTNGNIRLNKGDIVSLSLDPNSGGNARNGNENGIDILKVTDVDYSSFNVEKGIRFPYSYPILSKVNNVVKLKSEIIQGAFLIKGDFLNVFNSGDILRIENIDGTDGVGGSKYYFEYVKVKQVEKSHITLISRTIYSHTNPWIFKTNFVKGVSIDGHGELKKLVLRNIDGVKISSLNLHRLIISSCYSVNVNKLKLEGLGEPTTFNMTYCFGKSIIENLNISNSEGSSDNSTLKIMSSPQVILSNIVLSDSNSKSRSQSNYSIFIDAFFTPYSCWNDSLTVRNVICERPKSNFKRGVWFYGMRNSIVDSIVGADVFLQGSCDSYFNNLNIPKFKLEVKDLVRCNVTAKCISALVKGCIDNSFAFEFTDYVNTYDELEKYRCKLTLGGENPETGEHYSIGLRNHLILKVNRDDSNNYADVFLEHQNNLVIEPVTPSSLNTIKSLNIGDEVTELYLKNNFNRLR